MIGECLAADPVSIWRQRRRGHSSGTSILTIISSLAAMEAVFLTTFFAGDQNFVKTTYAPSFRVGQSPAVGQSIYCQGNTPTLHGIDQRLEESMECWSKWDRWWHHFTCWGTPTKNFHPLDQSPLHSISWLVAMVTGACPEWRIPVDPRGRCWCGPISRHASQTLRVLKHHLLLRCLQGRWQIYFIGKKFCVSEVGVAKHIKVFLSFVNSKCGRKMISWGNPTNCQTSNIRCTKSQNLNVSCLVLQLFLPNPLKPGV